MEDGWRKAEGVVFRMAVSKINKQVFVSLRQRRRRKMPLSHLFTPFHGGRAYLLESTHTFVIRNAKSDGGQQDSRHMLVSTAFGEPNLCLFGS